MSDNITNQVVESRLEYDTTLKKVSNFLNWQKSEDGKKVDMPKLDESHKEILFVNWDSQLRKAKQAVEDVATATNNVIECLNENLHNSNLVVETTPGFLSNAKQLQAVWK